MSSEREAVAFPVSTWAEADGASRGLASGLPSLPADPREQQVVERFLAGDEESVRQVRAWLAGAAARFRTRLRLPWEDLQQELLLELTSSLKSGSFRGEARLQTYAWRLAQYRCLNQLRAERRSREAPLDDLDSPPIACGRSALQHVLDDEALARLAALVERMPEECRQLWSMVAEGLSYEEMSRRTKVAAGTLRVRVLRCRQKARALVGSAWSWRRGKAR